MKEHQRRVLAKPHLLGNDQEIPLDVRYPPEERRLPKKKEEEKCKYCGQPVSACHHVHSF